MMCGVLRSRHELLDQREGNGIMRILILGVTGMLGHASFKLLSTDSRHEVWGTLREEGGRRFFAKPEQARLVTSLDILNQDSAIKVMNMVRPEVIINCVGLIKQLPGANDPLVALPINAMLPHRLARLTSLFGARLIHVSTDCVFSGRKGQYKESDVSDAEDLYGISKYIGELREYSHAITLRTSIIGHELQSRNALLEWFLSQRGEVKGYANAVFSGVPTVELARVVCDFVLPRANLNGVFHVSAQPISKLDLLMLIANTYGTDTQIVPDYDLVMDRSLNSDRFKDATGYVPPSWPELVNLMRKSAKCN
jgi:dTDP-4-dehydrorhamnose reductase